MKEQAEIVAVIDFTSSKSNSKEQEVNVSIVAASLMTTVARLRDTASRQVFSIGRLPARQKN